jgi:hypothetical protein
MGERARELFVEHFSGLDPVPVPGYGSESFIRHYGEGSGGYGGANNVVGAWGVGR